MPFLSVVRITGDYYRLLEATGNDYSFPLILASQKKFFVPIDTSIGYALKSQTEEQYFDTSYQ